MDRFGKEGSQQKINAGLALLESWDYKHLIDSAGAVLFHLWEYNCFKNMHSFKVRRLDMRLAMASPHTYDEFFYVEVDAWKDRALATQEYCRQIEFVDFD